mmetsp:Transcript_10449/g.31488  ORF Transcript_10449/g.31488 Transcript_10449/m.31488 type:complete len:253 (+) Transcript_10449:907-1665(+)
MEHGSRRRHKGLPVLQQRTGVPAQEENAILRIPRPAPRPEERRFLRGAVVVPGIVRAAVAPLRVARRSRSFPQRIERPRIVALELAHPGKAPAVGFHVSRVAQLATGPTAHHYLLYSAPQISRELCGKCSHEVRVALHRGAASEGRHMVGEQADVLPVDIALRGGGARAVREEHVPVLLGRLEHPVRKRDLGGVANVSSAGVEAHDGLHLEANALGCLKQGSVAAPVIHACFPLHRSPPNIDGNTPNSGAHQ